MLEHEVHHKLYVAVTKKISYVKNCKKKNIGYSMFQGDFRLLIPANYHSCINV